MAEGTVSWDDAGCSAAAEDSIIGNISSESATIE
jgi:hypothetical protein